MGKFNLKSLFIAEDPVASKKTEPDPEPVEEQPVKPTTKKYSKNIAPTTPEPEPQPVVQQAKIDKKIYKTLEDVLQDNDFGSYNYLEFRKTLQSLNDEIEDEKTKFVAALATASSMKATPDTLIETAKKYIDLLQKEKDKFEDEMKDLASSVKQKKTELKSVIDQLNELQTKKTTLENDIAEGDAEVASSRKTFDITLQTVIGEIQQDILKIGKYSIKKGGTNGNKNK